jgi:hypothetical protein
MPSPRRLKKIKTKLKRQRAKIKVTSAARTQTQSRPLQQDSAVGNLNADPKKLTPSDRQNVLRDLNRDIEGAKDLPPAEAGILLRAAYFLRQVLLSLDPQKKDSEGSDDDENKESAANAADLKKARDEFIRAKENVKNTVAAAGEGPIAAVTALKKKPKDMTADEISDAIAAVEKAIEDGKQDLLPADASRLQRALYALKMALFELGGVAPELAGKDKKELEELIKAKTGEAVPDPATQAKVTQAVADVNQVQADIASRNPASQNKKASEYPGLDVLTQKKR